MKLVISIVHQEDEHDLLKALSEKGFGVTKLASTGGFLKTGNTTFFTGVEKEKVPEVIECIKTTCRTRKEFTASASMLGDGSYIGIPLEVTVGGATVFVIDVEDHYKL